MPIYVHTARHGEGQDTLEMQSRVPAPIPALPDFTTVLPARALLNKEKFCLPQLHKPRL